MSDLPMSEPKLARIKLLLLDVDGVLTDGRIYYDAKGEEIKTFNSKDGLGLRLLMKAGIQVGIITARQSKALRHRCENLGIDLLFENVKDKASVLNRIAVRSGIGLQETAFVGDDLLDLPLFGKVLVAIAVADAHPVVREKADMVTQANGGAGAVREVCDAILKEKGLWGEIVARYTSPE
jgi:3-deoxy-D-manno-octulosonate 8-phosphate phosphatase (KDO 8-P phosphatase)